MSREFPFNPTLVQFKPRYMLYVTTDDSTFNPTLVQFKRRKAHL